MNVRSIHKASSEYILRHIEHRCAPNSRYFGYNISTWEHAHPLFPSIFAFILPVLMLLETRSTSWSQLLGSQERGRLRLDPPGLTFRALWAFEDFIMYVQNEPQKKALTQFLNADGCRFHSFKLLVGYGYSCLSWLPKSVHSKWLLSMVRWCSCLSDEQLAMNQTYLTLQNEIMSHQANNTSISGGHFINVYTISTAKEAVRLFRFPLRFLKTA